MNISLIFQDKDKHFSTLCVIDKSDNLMMFHFSFCSEDNLFEYSNEFQNVIKNDKKLLGSLYSKVIFVMSNEFGLFNNEIYSGTMLE